MADTFNRYKATVQYGLAVFNGYGSSRRVAMQRAVADFLRTYPHGGVWMGVTLSVHKNTGA